jgi:hypothetical protein
VAQQKKHEQNVGVWSDGLDLESIATVEAEQACRREADASRSLPQGGRHREAQSEPALHSRLDRPACTMCEKSGCEACYAIYLGPFWQDVAVPGSESLLSRIMGDAESINVCASCTMSLMRICDIQMREIRQMFSLQRLDKAHVLILALLKRQCAMAMQHGPV